MGINDGRVAIVTGALRCLGRSHALASAREGVKVVVNHPGSATSGDGRYGDRKLGALHIVVNNAGILRDRMLINMTEDEEA